MEGRNPEGVSSGYREKRRNSFRVATNPLLAFVTQGFKANTSTPRGLPAWGPRPGLDLANAFSVSKPRDGHVILSSFIAVTSSDCIFLTPRRRDHQATQRREYRPRRSLFVTPASR
jgi:hypothetical protein